jgi:chromosomal replication initiation ATPase DnaA
MNPYLIPGLNRKRQHEVILERLANYYQVDKQDILSKAKKYAKIKREAMYLIKTELQLEDSQIAEIFQVNRSSVFRNVQKQQAFIKVYPEVKAEMDKIIKVTLKTK